MEFSRREAISGLAALTSSVAFGGLMPRPGHAPFSRKGDTVDPTGFPRKADFDLVPGQTWINGAYTHPMPIASSEMYQRAVARRTAVGPRAPDPALPKIPHIDDAAKLYATLINAAPEEIALIPNTSTGENLVVEALGIANNRGNVVTDSLHFEGALLHLMELKKRGLDLRIVQHRPEGHIELADYARLVDRKTKLIEVSFVSMYNGFQHDLKAIADLAHAHGAYVYVDLIQGVGAVPFDVRATGVDFAATSSYKWLMGDFGVGFLYVRQELLGRVIQRTHWSYDSAPDTGIHLSPLDPARATPLTYTPGTDAASTFQLGTMALSVGAALGTSIPYLMRLGVEHIQQWRQPMLAKLQAEMPRLGYLPQTPAGSSSPIVTFAHKDPEGITKKLAKAGVTVRVADYWMRIAPSVFNDMADIDRLLEALA